MFSTIGYGLNLIKDKLKKTKENILHKFNSIFSLEFVHDKNKLREQIFEILFSSDFGVEISRYVSDQVTNDIIDNYNISKVKEDMQYVFDMISKFLIEKMQGSEGVISIKNDEVNIIFLIGINGSGKTSFAGKIANKFVDENYKVLLVAADTFRAAAVEQAEIIAGMSNCDFYKTKTSKASAVVYEAIKYAKEMSYDICIIDLAGRMENNNNLMAELKKIINITSKFENMRFNKEVLIVADSTSGQVAIDQSKKFLEATNATGIVISKLDSSSKGGIVFSLYENLKIPIKGISFGEKLSDIDDFNINDMVKDIFLNS